MNEPRKPVERSFPMKLAGYYLARCGIKRPNKPASPPAALEVNSWNEAYDIFYESMGDGRPILQFRNSLKNSRDPFDIFFENNRIGWKGKNQQNPSISIELKRIHEEWEKRSDKELENCIFNLLNKTDSFDIEPKTEHEAKTEGGERVFVSTKRERHPKLRKEALRLHGYTCMGCNFNFEEFYGELGKGFIEVHHIVPLSEAGIRKTNPETDLIVLCANCHRIVHRKNGICLSLSELKWHIMNQALKEMFL